MTTYPANLEVPRPSEISDLDVERYTNGLCGRLAWAIHKDTEWPVIGLVEPDGTWFHALVETPEGDLMDIVGVRHRNAVAADYDDFGEWDFEDLAERDWLDEEEKETDEHTAWLVDVLLAAHFEAQEARR